MRKPELVRFEIEGAEMAVRLAGDREKPALLLIHGFPGSSESFRNVIGTLARDCFVVAPDLPGFGGSEPVERPSFSDRKSTRLNSSHGYISYAVFCLKKKKKNRKKIEMQSALK